jgi:hypothetical protein
VIGEIERRVRVSWPIPQPLWSVERAEESGAWPGGSLFQNLADVEFGDGFPRDVAGNNLGVDVRLPAIAKDKPVAHLVVEDLEFLV